MNVLPLSRQVQAIAALTEGCSIRATERMTDIHRDTVMRLGVRVGEGCARLHDAMMRDLNVNLVELDEQWAFLGKKQRRVTADDRPEMGDIWLFIALDATNKAVLSYTVGKRLQEHFVFIANDLRARVLNRPQITSDGFLAYINAVKDAFGNDVDFGQLIKYYSGDSRVDTAHRYSPGWVIGAEKTVICGRPDPTKISTSYVERFNLTTRMQLRRFTRLTSGFSKSLRNHRAAVSLHLAHYNLCRVHETLRCTPAMALGVTDHIWTVAELIEAALSAPVPPPLPMPGQLNLGMSVSRAKGEMRGGYQPRRPRPFKIIKGGLS